MVMIATHAAKDGSGRGRAGGFVSRSGMLVAHRLGSVPTGKLLVHRVGGGTISV